MKTSLRLTIAICFILSFVQAQAQVKFGPEVGLNLAKMTLKLQGLVLTPKQRLVFTLE
ncbi:MAG: hypothetical protein Q7U54_10660 [Bacteroidales bacterium]|nr:hypothetical protein [Bacteroidales bacterium]